MNYIRKLRADKTFLIEGALGDNPKLMGRLRTDGRITLYLEYYFGKIQAVSNKNLKTYGKNIRRHEILKFYLYDSPGNADQRRHNRQSLSVARKIRYERDQQLAERQCGYSFYVCALVEYSQCKAVTGAVPCYVLVDTGCFGPPFQSRLA